MIDPNDFIITKKRKKYKFAQFANSPLCFEADQWQQQPVDMIEVGAGTGLFSVAYAEQSPSTCVAVDVKADRLIQGARIAQAQQLSNILFLRARADQLESLFAPQSLAAIWVTFPDPFPKKRSSGRRLTHPTFLRHYAALLQQNGALYFKTDARELFMWSMEQFVAEGWHIAALSFDLHDSELDSIYKRETTYEARFRAEEIPINFLKAYPPEPRSPSAAS